MAKSKNGRNANGNGNGKKRNGNGNGSITKSIAISYAGANTRRVNNNTLVMSGSDFYERVKVKASPVSGEFELNKFAVSPSTFVGTRIAQIASTWERYYFTKFNVRYVPAVPTTLACQLVGYIDTDPLDQVVQDSPDQMLRAAVAHTGAQQWNFIMPKVIPLPMRKDRMQYYTGTNHQNERLAYQGKFHLLQVTRPIDINGAPVVNDLESGSLFIDWQVEFQTPQLSSSVLGTLRVSGTSVVRSPSVSDTSAGSHEEPLTITGLKQGDRYAIALTMSAANAGTNSLTVTRMAVAPGNGGSETSGGGSATLLRVSDTANSTLNAASGFTGGASDITYNPTLFATVDEEGRITTTIYYSITGSPTVNYLGYSISPVIAN